MMDTTKQKLLQAQQLLKNKQYPQARQILETLPHNTIAQQWLAKLNQISPQNGSKDKLVQANQLLRQKRYDEARQILEALPDNPTARQWLAKLDEIAPKVDDDLFSYVRPVNKSKTATLPDVSYVPPKPTFNQMSQDEKDRLVYVNQLIQQKKFDQAREILKSMPHNTFAQDSLRQLNDIAPKQKTAAPVFATGVGLAVFGKILRSRVLLRLTLGIIVFTGLVIFNFLRGDPMYENASVKFEYPQSWETIKLSDIELCETHPYPCFFLIGNGDSFSYSYVVMSEIPVEKNQTLDTLDEYWWNQFRPDAGAANFTEAQEINVDGARAISHDFELIFPDDKRYFRQIHVMNGSSLLEITFWAVNRETFNKKQDDFLKVLNSLDLKSA